MSNHFIVWNGWIFPHRPAAAHLPGPTAAEIAKFEQIVSNDRSKVLAPVPRIG